ncbi:THAP-type domain-containing protein, partial [Aphis craccivora]
LKDDVQKLKEENEYLLIKNKWYQDFIDTECNRFEREFGEILSKLFTPSQIDLILNPKKKVYRWTPEDISSAITLRSISPKSYRYMIKKNFHYQVAVTINNVPNRNICGSFIHSPLVRRYQFSIS